MPQIKIPILNCFNFVDVNRQLDPHYHYKSFDAWTSFEQQTEFENSKGKAQKVQRNDISYIQVKADYSPIRLRIRNSMGRVVLQQVMSNVATVAGVSYYQDQIAWDSFATPDGYYLLEIMGGDPILQVLQTEVLNVRTSHPHTVYLQYSNKFNNQILWETNIMMGIRLDLAIIYDAPATVRTGYVDQPLAGQTIKGDASRSFKLYAGIDGGMTQPQFDKLDEILNQTDLTFDGVGFAVNPGSAWSIKRLERFPYLQANIELRETVNRREKVFDVTGLQEQKIAMDYIIDTKLFGPVMPGNVNNDNTANIVFVD